jgi:hypothetical protein
MDLAIAATANVHRVPLLTDNVGEFRIISDLVDARPPSRADAEAPPADSRGTSRAELKTPPNEAPGGYGFVISDCL